MDQFEFTKIAGAVLAALLLIFGTKTIIEMNVGHTPEKPGFQLPAPTAEAAKSANGAAGEAARPQQPLLRPPAKRSLLYLPKANAENGKSIFKKCHACHVSEKGKTPTVGPNLWGVVNRPKATYPGFSYSEAMKAKGGDWSFEELGAIFCTIRRPIYQALKWCSRDCRRLGTRPT